MVDATRRACVALVEDDASLCRSLARFLHASGMRSVGYRCAEDFLDDRGRHEFDCLILDVQLDGMPGIELRDRLLKQGLTMPVIFSTAHDEPELRERALRGRCTAFLRKSEPGAVLLAAIERAICSGVR